MPTKDKLAPKAAQWVDPNLISAQMNTDLLTHLEKTTLTSEQKAAFIDECNSLSSVVFSSVPKVVGDSVKNETKKIRDAAKRLLIAINGASDETLSALKTHSAFLVQNGKPPVQLPESVLIACRDRKSNLVRAGRDHVEAVHLVADYTYEEIKPSRQGSPKKNAARSLTQFVAEAYRNTTGELPPSSRNGWFSPFMAELGKPLGLVCGPRVVSDVVGGLSNIDTR